MGWYGDDYGYKPYVPVAQRRAQAAQEVARRIKKGEAISPVVIEGRTIASTFWGKAWCEHLESYSDYANRLPRGRTYARNGSVVHLAIEPGRIKALVSGSSLYKIQIDITPLAAPAWQALKQQCAGQVGTIVELLQGKLSAAVMATVTDRDRGLFPKPKEITMNCSCPDGAGMCKHLAAVMYGVGHRLDSAPELLFKLRSVNPAELIAQAFPAPSDRANSKAPRIAATDLGAIFDIEIDEAPTSQPKPKAPKKPAAKLAQAQPVAPTKPTAPAKLVATSKPATPSKLSKPAAATKPATPIKPSKLVSPSQPAIPAKQAPVVAKQLPALKALIAGTKPAVAATKPTPAVATKQTPVAPAKPAPLPKGKKSSRVPAK